MLRGHSKYDKEILNFLHGTNKSYMVETPAKLRTVRDTTKHRILQLGLIDIKVTQKNDRCFLSRTDDKHVDANLEIYENLEVTIKANKQKKYMLAKEREIERNKLIHKEKIIKKIDKYVYDICTDFTEEEKKIITSKIRKRKHMFNASNLLLQVSVAIFLLSRCPANSDTPLKIDEIGKRVRNINPKLTHNKINRVINSLKRKGFEMCRITPEQIILTHKEKILSLYKEDNPLDIIKKAIEVVNDKYVRLSTVGRNPYVVATGAISFCSYRSIVTLKDLSSTFNISTNSVRKMVQTISTSPTLSNINIEREEEEKLRKEESKIRREEEEVYRMKREKEREKKREIYEAELKKRTDIIAYLREQNAQSSFETPRKTYVKKP